MTKLQELKNKIIELVPKIQSGFDCECGKRIYLGRDIILDDILIALNKKNPKRKIDDSDNIDYGKYIESDWYEIQGLLNIWKLGKSLDNQSKETIDFLHEILC